MKQIQLVSPDFICKLWDKIEPFFVSSMYSPTLNPVGFVTGSYIQFPLTATVPPISRRTFHVVLMLSIVNETSFTPLKPPKDEP